MIGNVVPLSSRFQIGLLAVCALLLATLWFAQLNPYLNPADDSGRYMVLGESLAKTGDLRLINDVRQLRDTLYVPGFPAIIALWIRITGLDPGGVVVPVKTTLFILLLSSLPLVLVLLVRAKLRPTSIVIGMIAYSASPTLASYANSVVSEIPLMVLCLAGIVFAGTYKDPTASHYPTAEEVGPMTDQEIAVPCASNVSLDLSGRPNLNREAVQEPRSSLTASGATGTQPLHAKDTQDRGSASRQYIPIGFILGSLMCAVLAYYVRAVGVVLLLSVAIWFWRSSGWRWGVGTIAVALLVVGSWQIRTSSIIKQDPPGTPHDTYAKQFTLKDPDKPDAGRIQLNPLGIAGRIRRCFPPNIGNIPRSLLFSMSAKGSSWQQLFFVIATPITIFALFGVYAAWKRGMYLVCGFSALFWVFISLWPWISPRFLVPLLPYTVLFIVLGAEAMFDQVGEALPKQALTATAATAVGLLLLYYARVHATIIPRERAATLHGYVLGRTRDEAGFYAAAEWLRGRESTGIVMARPAYLMHLYSLHPTTQVEPAVRPRVQELAYMIPNRVRYIVFDRWPWAHTNNYLGPYLKDYRTFWSAVWVDPGGSGVAIFRRND